MQIYSNVLQYWGQVFLEQENSAPTRILNNSICDALEVQAQNGGFDGCPTVFDNNACVRNAQGYAVPLQ